MIANGRTRLAGCAVTLYMIACGADSANGQPDGAQPSSDPEPASSGQPPGRGQPAPTGPIVVSFKLDPRLHGGTYGGDIWLTPSTYVGAAAQDVVEARARGVDANGHASVISPSWIPSDPGMLTVSPDQGSQVTITVNRGGESSLDLTWNGFTKALLFRAIAVDGAVTQVEISQ
jgi:hypothetical protein